MGIPSDWNGCIRVIFKAMPCLLWEMWRSGLAYVYFSATCKGDDSAHSFCFILLQCCPDQSEIRMVDAWSCGPLTPFDLVGWQWLAWKSLNGLRRAKTWVLAMGANIPTTTFCVQGPLTLLILEERSSVKEPSCTFMCDSYHIQNSQVLVYSQEWIQLR